MDAIKTIQKYGTIFVIAVAGGFLGSSLHERVGTDSDVVRAKRYEVIGQSGKVLSYWDPDSNPRLQPETPKGLLLVFMDPDGVRRAQIGSSIGSYAPELLFYGRQGPSESRPRESPREPRLRIGLGYNDDPLLTMLDGSTRKVLLGAYHGDAPSAQKDDWRITFMSQTGAAVYMGTHGVNSGRSQAFVTVSDDKGLSWSLPTDFHYEIERIPIVPRSH
jgi:hypothetical protein